MAAQGSALRQISRDIWRMNISGIGMQMASLAGPVLSLHQHKTLSSLSHNGLPKTQSPPSFALFQQLQCGERKDTIRVNGQVNSNKMENVENLLDISVIFTGLSLHAPKVVDDYKSWSLSTSGPSNLSEHLEYVCPSQKLITLPGLAILEEMPGGAFTYDLPKTHPLVSLIDAPSRPGGHSDISEPTGSQTHAPKEARKIMKIRRKKMKRHLLKKFRKRMAFTLRKMKRDRRKKKEIAEQARLASIKEWGDSFDAQEWLREELHKARLGGFYINVLADKR